MAVARVNIVNVGNILGQIALTNEDIRFINLCQVLFGVPNLQYLQWLAARRLIANSCICNTCSQPMSLNARNARIDGYVWRCQQCHMQQSVRHGSFFARSHLPLPTIVAFIYYWSVDTPLHYIMHELQINSWHTVVD